MMLKLCSPILLFALIACSGTPRQDAGFDKAAVELEVRTMFDQYFEAIRNGGLKAEFEYLDQTEDFFWVPPGFDSALGIDSVKSILTKNATSIEKIHFKWLDLQVHPQSNMLATYTGIVHGNMTDTAGTIQSINLIESGTVIKRKTGWKLLCGQSRNLPAN